MEQQMKAIGFRQYGPPEVLEPLTVPRPTLTADGVLVRVVAAGVNPADWRIRSGQFKFFAKAPLPFIPGADIAGRVEAVGAGVTRFRPGDAVYALLPTLRGGGYAEYAVVAEHAAATKPAALSFAEAAAVPLAALTALQALRDKAQLQPGAHVLIYGASGGVGTFAVQIAKALGARVTAVCSGRNATLVQRLGADNICDYTQAKVTTGGKPYDVVLDAVNHVPFWPGLRIVRPNGVFVSVNPLFGLPVLQWLARLRGRRLQAVLVQPQGADLATLTQWIEAGQVRPVLDQYYPLADAAIAHRYSESQRVRGKLVLILDAMLAQAA